MRPRGASAWVCMHMRTGWKCVRVGGCGSCCWSWCEWTTLTHTHTHTHTLTHTTHTRVLCSSYCKNYCALTTPKRSRRGRTRRLSDGGRLIGVRVLSISLSLSLSFSLILHMYNFFIKSLLSFNKCLGIIVFTSLFMSKNDIIINGRERHRLLISIVHICIISLTYFCWEIVG